MVSKQPAILLRECARASRELRPQHSHDEDRSALSRYAERSVPRAIALREKISRSDEPLRTPPSCLFRTTRLGVTPQVPSSTDLRLLSTATVTVLLSLDQPHKPTGTSARTLTESRIRGPSIVFSKAEFASQAGPLSRRTNVTLRIPGRNT